MSRKTTSKGVGFRMHGLAVQDLFYAERRVQALGNELGFNVLMLGPEFQRYAEEQAVFLHGFAPNLGVGHWNVAGHRLASELIAKGLCSDDHL